MSSTELTPRGDIPGSSRILPPSTEDGQLHAILALACRVTRRERGLLAVFDQRERMVKRITHGGGIDASPALLERLRRSSEPTFDARDSGDPSVVERLAAPVGPSGQGVLLLGGAHKHAPERDEARSLAGALADIAWGRLQDTTDKRRLREELRRLRDQRSPFSTMLWASSRLSVVLRKLAQVAGHRMPVLLYGEDGTEKEDLARFLHASDGQQPGGPFAAVYAGSAPAHRIEHELFSAEPRTTLYVDQPEALRLDVQNRLAAFLTDPARDLRLVAGSIQTAAELEREATLQPALAKLLEVRVAVPPLRAAPADISTLVELILRQMGPGLVSIHDRAMKYLVSYAWPQNVRELHKVLESAAAKAGDEMIQPKHLARAVRTDSVDPSQRYERLREIERRHISAVVAAVASKREAAKVLGIAPSTLYEKLARYEADE